MTTTILHTRSEIQQEIKVMEQVMYRARSNPRGYADANMYEYAIENLKDILDSTNWDMQLADCNQYFLV
jgi:hypothetical protein